MALKVVRRKSWRCFVSIGNFVPAIAHIDDETMTRVKLPSGARKTVNSDCRAMVGIIAGGGRMDKPISKAGHACHKYRTKRHEWPKVRGVATDPVDHPHDGGNHQHIGHPATVGRRCSPGQNASRRMPQGDSKRAAMR
jgi:large subunit ribosomal protein L8e